MGLGIAGKEGKAATRAADFAFSQFMHLQRILLVHGHWYYVRVSTLIQYSFYKNVTAFVLQFFFASYTNWSSMSLYESLFLFLTLKRLRDWSTISSPLVVGAGPLSDPLVVCLRGSRAIFPTDLFSPSLRSITARKGGILVVTELLAA